MHQPIRWHIRLGAFLFLAVLASAQHPRVFKSEYPSTSEPPLPVIDDKACPVSHRADGAPEPIQKKIERNGRMYSSWEAKRVSVGTLKVGEQVTVLSGVNVIREPDKVRILQPISPGEVPPLYRLVGSSDELKRRIIEAVGNTAEVAFVLEIPFMRLRTVDGIPTMVAKFTTDIPGLSNWGAPVLLGPGSIHVAHTERERLAKRELHEAVELYSNVARKLVCG